MAGSVPQQTKAQRREAARLEAQRVAEANAARDARTKRIIWGVLGALMVALVAAVLVVARPWERDAPVPNFTAVPLDQVTNVPANTTYEGGFALTAAGGSTGVLDPNLPTLDVYFDYRCIWCQHFEDINQAGIEALTAAGEANIVMHPVAIMNQTNPRAQFSTRAVAAAGWIAQYAPEHFWQFHLSLFANQPNEANPDLTNRQIANIAEAVGVPASVAAGIADGTATNTFGEWAVSLTAHAVADPALQNPDGGFGTPTILLDGVRFDGDWTDPQVIPDAIALAAAARD